MNIQSEFKALKETVRELGTVLVAYSRGMDSTLLLKTCVDVLGNEHVVAFIGNAPTFPAKEIQEAEQTASDISVKCLIYSLFTCPRVAGADDYSLFAKKHKLRLLDQAVK